jgi:LmbE family N-acetylglucosaminyl deacetylase
MSDPEPQAKRILVLSPHPDDEAIGLGGAIRHHVVTGDKVRVVFLTSGENGGHGVPPDVTLPIREAEAQQAAEILGSDSIEFWRQPDGNLKADAPLVRRLRDAIEAFEPNRIYVPHQDEMHPDHREAAHLVHRALTELQANGAIPSVLMYEVWTPLQHMDEVLDISTHIETKLAAIRAYVSQCRVMRFDEAALGLNRYRGEMHSWPGGDYAEIFQRMRL